MWQVVHLLHSKPASCARVANNNFCGYRILNRSQHNQAAASSESQRLHCPSGSSTFISGQCQHLSKIGQLWQTLIILFWHSQSAPIVLIFRLERRLPTVEDYDGLLDPTTQLCEIQIAGRNCNSTFTGMQQLSDIAGQPDTSHGMPFPDSGRLLGIDYGTVRVGIAICDAGWTLASPLETLTRRSQTLDADFFTKLVEQEQIVGIVVGLPLHVSGDESQKSEEARQYGKWLAGVTGLPVVWVDERYTSAHAEEILLAAQLTSKKRKARIDMLAAQAILATWIDRNKKNTRH